MKDTFIITKEDISTALYDTFACLLGPDSWEEAELEFWKYLKTSQQPNAADGDKAEPNPYLLDGDELARTEKAAKDESRR